MFYLVGIFRTSSPGDSLSSNPERIALRMWGQESGYIEICNKRHVVWTSKIFLWIKTRYLRLRNLELFLYGKMQESGHWNHSLHMHLDYPEPTSCCLLTFWAPLGLAVGSGCSPDGCQITGIFLLPEERALEVKLEACTHWWLWHPCLLVWQEIFHFSKRTLILMPSSSCPSPWAKGNN